MKICTCLCTKERKKLPCSLKNKKIKKGYSYTRRGKNKIKETKIVKVKVTQVKKRKKYYTEEKMTTCNVKQRKTTRC